MPRRSSRLQSLGYYNNEGESNISYKETLNRRRRSPSRIKRQQTNSSSNSSMYSSTDISMYSSTDISMYSSRDDSMCSCRDDHMNRRKRNSNSPTTQDIIGLLLVTLPLCLGIIYLFLPVNRTPGARISEPPVSPPIVKTDSNAFEKMAEDLKELRDDMVTLKKMMNYLLPKANTMPNFALESLGASILYSQSSETYNAQQLRLKFFGIPLWTQYSQRRVIQGYSPLVPGCCWAFASGRGHLSITLSHPVAISHVTLGHVSKNLSPTGSVSSAPKEFSVYGMQTPEDQGTKLGTFLYDQDGDSVQTFKLPDHIKGVFNHVRLQVESNWGHPDYTCLYNFRVHGKLAD